MFHFSFDRQALVSGGDGQYQHLTHLKGLKVSPTTCRTAGVHVIEISIPPLRQRRGDIRLLVEHIFARNNAEDRLANLPAKLREMLYHYEWPGNVRELMNTIQRYLATESISLPGGRQMESGGDRPADAGLYEAVESLERRMLADALKKTKWRRDKTAELLRIPRRSLQRKMQKYKLRSPE